MEKEQKCMIDTRKKIIEYKECLERQLCFVNDCRLGKEAIYLGRYEKTFLELAEAYPHAYDNICSEAK